MEAGMGLTGMGLKSKAVKRFRVLVAVLALSVAAFRADAAQMRFIVDAAATPVTFILSDPLHTVHGTFKLKSGTIVFDPEGGAASGELVVDATSGDSGSNGRDSRMHKNILESAKYPDIVFTPDRVEGKVALDGDSEVTVHGMFRIHGVDHEVTLPAKTHITGDKVSADIRFPVPYVKWGMKNPSTFILRVGDTVQIEIHAVGQLSPTDSK
jgi:polyisoprenoid-binding protein YceI